MATHLGESDYREAGLQRLNESGILLRGEWFAGAVYLGGRAVESMLRALIWKNDPEIRSGRRSLETGHDLREMLALVGGLGLLAEDERRTDLVLGIQRIGRLWFNNMRFVPNAKLKRIWWELGEVSGKRTLKRAAAEFYDVCSAVVKRCETLCQS